MDNKFDFDRVNTGLFKFLDASPNAFYAVANIKTKLKENGFMELSEDEPWELKAGENYYVARNDSALIAFRVPKEYEAGTENIGFQMMVAHSDSPCFKIKLNAELEVDKAYVKLNTEAYGGMLMAPWLDRPLSAAGRVVAETDEGIETRLINLDRDLLIIPSVAIHMNREANSGFRYNAQNDMLPLCGELGSRGGFKGLIAQAAGVDEAQLLDADLYLYNRMRAVRLGINQEFIASGRLDDLQCAYAAAEGLLEAENVKNIAL